MFRDKVSLAGLGEVSLLAAAGTAEPTSDAWEASNYSMGSNGKDLGNIK